VKSVALKNDFSSWRDEARDLLSGGVPPAEVQWEIGSMPGLFRGSVGRLSKPLPSASVPRRFLLGAERVACHKDEGKWDLLYRLLWRICHGERNLLEVPADPETHRFLRMERAVERDLQKMKAFVRFRKVILEGEEQFLAFHTPEHHVLKLAAPFFARRYADAAWGILTPYESAFWDTRSLRYGRGAGIYDFPSVEELEELWREFRTRDFSHPAPYDPAPPEFHVPTPPERAEGGRSKVVSIVGRERGRSPRGEAKPDRIPSLGELQRSAEGCTNCPLFRVGGQAVFGDGPKDASVVFVGEQPGEEEEKRGKPFVGPAGRLLFQALVDAGLDRSETYVTNAVKHFKWVPKGKRRIHQKPNGAEITACRHWLAGELRAIRPKLIVCLGATAAQSVLGRTVHLSTERGSFVSTPFGIALLTVHPSALLRIPDPAGQERAYRELVNDLERVREKLQALENEEKERWSRSG
jgi:probable DNA metabolism protein